MKKSTVMTVLLVFGLSLLLFCDSAFARRGALRGGGGGGDSYGAQAQKDDDAVLNDQDLAKICFVKKENGREMVFLRMPPGMYRMAKARAKAKRRGMVRVKLRPRHLLAIEEALGERPKRVMIRLSAKRMRTARGLKGHYVVRPLDQFMRELE